MANYSILDQVFNVDTDQRTPKYKQIIQNVLEGITNKSLKKDDHLPSINMVCDKFHLSRDTVVKAYNQLKEMGLLVSVPGKGFFIRCDDFQKRTRVFVLFDKFTAYKEQLYRSIKESIGDQVELDIFFHHHNPKVFRQLLNSAKGEYNHYVVMPFAEVDNDPILSKLDQDRLLILDIATTFPRMRCASIYQNFDSQMSKALESGLDKIRKYESFTLVLGDDSGHPMEAKVAFAAFCNSNRIAYDIVKQLDLENIKKGHLYFTIEDTELIVLVKYCHSNKLKIGEDIGILSYNDTPFKEIIEGGISLLSTDFTQMGIKVAEWIKKPQVKNEIEPTNLIIRNSF